MTKPHPDTDPNEIIVTLDQPCACNFPNANAYDLCVMLLAREYQSTFLRVHQQNLMRISEILFVSLPNTIKRKISLYTLPLITPPPKIHFRPYPTNVIIKEWIHEYDIHLEDLVDEIQRVEKRLVDLRNKNKDSKVIKKLEELDDKHQKHLIVKRSEKQREDGLVDCRYVPKKEKLTVDSIKQLTKETMEKYKAFKMDSGELDYQEEEDHEHTPPDIDFLRWLNTFDMPSELLEQPVPESFLKSMMDTEIRGFDPTSSFANPTSTGSTSRGKLPNPVSKIGKKRIVSGRAGPKVGSSGMTSEEKENIAVIEVL
ncbi:hypothetical protein V865_007896 [Kwoniella europaea PYCC6329]|uniref:Uncharacterized protein n=1 Tax=Kwoniella europaea PYCC6329 TaxID=1423913 RepID=A0AAX4KVE7_9TREE